MGEKKPRIVFFVSEDWYFCSHRLPIARAARDSGYEVWVITRVKNHGKAIKDEGFFLLPLDFQRSGINIFSDAIALWRLIRFYRYLRPVIAHHVAIKPVLYGSIAARIAGVSSVVNALAGLGYLYSEDVKGLFLLLQPAVRIAMRLILLSSRGRVIVQNHADYDSMHNHMGLLKQSLVLIRGSGVDMKHFAPTPEPSGPIRVTLVSRLLWEKGVGDLVKAAELLRERGVRCVVTLVGDPDTENAGAIDEELLLKWAKSGAIEWWGRREDVAAVWAQSHIACLPSYYREGVPKSLLEASACGRPIVTSDNPGCMEIVVDGENGLVVPARDSCALADAIEKLVKDSVLRQKMGSQGRKMVGLGFSEEQVADKTLTLYEELRQKNG